MLRTLGWAVAAGVLTAAPASAANYSIQTAATPPPKEIKEAIAQLLTDQSVRFLDAKGALIGEFWFRKEVPSRATAQQVKNGLTYRELQESTVLGAVRFAQQVTDYRKQKVKPGVYTMRLGFQPMDGDHMGTAPFPEFLLLAPAALDEKPEILATKELQELSAKATTGSHPAVFLLFPNAKPDDAPKLVSKGSKNWVLELKEDVMADGQKGSLGLAVNLIGHAD